MKQITIFLVLLFSHCFADDTSSLLLSCFSNEKKWPALHYAIEQEQADVARILVSLYPEQIRLRTPENQTAFELALIHGDEELAEILLENGFLPNQWVTKAQEDIFPLYFAIKYHAVNVAKILLEKGAEPFVIRNKITATLFCVEQNADDILRLVLEKQGVEIDEIENAVAVYKEFEVNDLDWPPLHYALYKDDLENFSSLLRYGSDPNFQGRCSKSLYRLAMENRDSSYRALLREYGFNLHHALLDAISAKDEQEAFIIAAHENWAQYNYASSLWVATRENMAGVVQLLLEKGVRDNPPPAPQAASYAIDKPDIMRLLLEYDAYPRVLPHFPNSGKLVSGYLEAALRMEQYDTCHLLLEHGVFPNEISLRLVAIKGLEYTQLFHKFNALDNNVINYAIEYKNLEVLDFLLHSGYSPSDSAFRSCISHDTLDCFIVLNAHFAITEEQKKNYLKQAISLNKSNFVEYILSIVTCD